MDIILYQIFVQGRVQGVWFRKYACDEAKIRGLKGFVRNEKDYGVYIEAEGSLDQLNEFVQWLYEGSPLSKVSSVKFDIGKNKHFNTFEIES